MTDNNLSTINKKQILGNLFDNELNNANSLNAIEMIENFVTDRCSGRKPSHNHIHMFKVRNNSIEIVKWLTPIFYFTLFMLSYIFYRLHITNLFVAFIFNIIGLALIDFNKESLLFMVSTVALLHDVADHKYVEEDSSLLADLNSFLVKLTTNSKYKSIVAGTLFEYLFNPDMIIKIIERISYSRQVKYGTKTWYSTLGIWGVLVRHIVSDADKLEAIGKDGIDRCKDYTIENYEKNQIEYTQIMLNEDIIKHYNIKLKHMASFTFMKTIPGWFKAQRLDKDMRVYINSFKTN